MNTRVLMSLFEKYPYVHVIAPRFSIWIMGAEIASLRIIIQDSGLPIHEVPYFIEMVEWAEEVGKNWKNRAEVERLCRNYPT